MNKSANRRGSVSQPDLSVLGPIREIIRLVEIGARSKSQLQAFVEGRNPFEVGNPLDIDGVITILGVEKVVTYDQACEAFGRDKGDSTPTIRYTEETLRECAVLNRVGTADWRMVYAHPLSLREQREVIGTDTDSQPCFYDNDWWLGDKEDVWAKSQPEAGYYLIDIKGRFNRTNWNDQNTRIAEMGEQYQRADERVVAQALISIFKTTGERLFDCSYHWGRIRNSRNFLVVLGSFSSSGLVVSAGRQILLMDNLFVCVSRKFQS